MKIFYSLLVAASLGVAILLAAGPANAAYSLGFGGSSGTSRGSCDEMVKYDCDCVCLPGSGSGVSDCYYFDNGLGCQACSGSPCGNKFVGVWSGGGFLL